MGLGDGKKGQGSTTLFLELLLNIPYWLGMWVMCPLDLGNSPS